MKELTKDDQVFVRVALAESIQDRQRLINECEALKIDTTSMRRQVQELEAVLLKTEY